MEIKEVQEKKDNLEKMIDSLIKEFEESTGMKINSLYLYSFATEDRNRTCVTVQI